MVAPKPVPAAPRTSSGDGGDDPLAVTPHARVDRPLNRRTLDDVLFSLSRSHRRLRQYGTALDFRSLEIEETVMDRLLREYVSLGGVNITLEEAMSRWGPEEG